MASNKAVEMAAEAIQQAESRMPDDWELPESEWYERLATAALESGAVELRCAELLRELTVDAQQRGDSIEAEVCADLATTLEISDVRPRGETSD